jgi:RNA polymerase sigma factor (sigma-70 family)
VNDQTDTQLLAAYAAQRSEPAFAELVRRHVDLVHSAAQRMVGGDAHLAQDVTQGVFLALAKNAAQLADRAVLAGWLHRTAQNLAAQTVRTDVRRRAREQEVAAMNETSANDSEPSWQAIAPHLDTALGELPDADREAVLLRYFARQSAREMAQTLGTSEDAAQKRTARALERLREIFSKRGVTIGAGGLAVAISANAVSAAPAGLALAISSAAATTFIGTTVATTTKIIAMTTIQKTLVTLTVAALASVGIYEARQSAQLRDQVQTLQREQASSAEQLQQLASERDAAIQRLAALAADAARLKSNSNQSELLKLRGEVTRLRDDSKTLSQLKSKKRTIADDPAMSGFMDLAFAEMRNSMTNTAISQVKELKAKLGLSEAQADGIRAILFQRAVTQSQIYTDGKSGKINDQQAHDLFQKMFADDERAIVALLEPEQQTAYAQLQKDNEIAGVKRLTANEANFLKRTCELTKEQADAAAKVLAALPRGQGGLGGDATDRDAEAQLDARVQALQSLLTPAQLDAYRQAKLHEIEFAQAAAKLLGPVAP